MKLVKSGILFPVGPKYLKALSVFKMCKLRIKVQIEYDVCSNDLI